jgi:2-keto-4-pentenoate hydratase/2-oxohepta-3-ene-1,7-dioic acid hydratase in catechol pathway
MRLSAFEIDGERHLCVDSPGLFFDLGPVSLDDLLRAQGGAATRIQLATAVRTTVGSGLAIEGPPPGARRLAPLLRPANQMFVGVNYADHVAELPPPWKMTADPFVFSKLNSSIIAPGDAIRVPAPDAKVDYEAELMLVIGERASRLTPDNALEHVFGYTVVNDVTERAVQATDNQLTMAKGMDTFCPMGPLVVLADEVPDPGALEIWTTVNGEERQRSNTRELVFSIVDLLVHITRTVTLQPGDTISTGTPAGVGAFRDPPVFLAPGDTVTVAVEGIGELTNPVVAGYDEAEQ